MNREIKFRAWDAHYNEMRYSDKHDGEFYINSKGALYMYSIPERKTGFKQDFYVTYDLMQYTGLKDKNGVDIYEGDILQYHKKSGIEGRDDLPRVGIVEFIDGEFAIRIEENPIISFSRTVIGNIYEDADLLRSAAPIGANTTEGSKADSGQAAQTFNNIAQL